RSFDAYLQYRWTTLILDVPSKILFTISLNSCRIETSLKDLSKVFKLLKNKNKNMKEVSI
ncbi:MAG: hypothetical protein COZ29_02420, partial [Candidatus Moranbacteria bacterium CG_4_10_14_3_um_filter_45_9]